MPVIRRAHRRGWQQRWLAGCIAVLLAIAPFAQPSLTLDFGAAAAAESIATFDHDAPANQPSPALRPAPPLSLGILARASLLESALGLSPVKPPSLRPSVPRLLRAAIQAATAFGGDTGATLHRDAVGTARTPTGPPS